MGEAGTTEEREGTRPVLRLVAAAAAAILVGGVASAELVGSVGLHLVSAGSAVVLLAVPALFLVTAARRWAGWWRLLGPACSIVAVASVLVAISCRPLSHVRGVQTGGFAGVAIVMFAVSVLRGDYVVRLPESSFVRSVINHIDREGRAPGRGAS